MKPYSDACDENREPILAVIRQEFSDCHRILEIGSGTGQHAVYFARQLPHLTWQPSDIADNHPGINAWRCEAGLDNVPEPLRLDVSRDDWPASAYDGVFSANTCHIMSWQEVEAMFRGIGRVLVSGGVLCLYGPFNYNNAYTSDSNARFDAFLKSRDPASGIRNFEDLDSLAGDNGMRLQRDHEMPVNNRLLVWSRQ
jgi:cyclopropane fatty-acyl-phospholipid synthase-like methyltransferase